jgi:hypothetical protein
MAALLCQYNIMKRVTGPNLMKLRMWVDIAEITASVAVVVTLLLLILQMRESDERERVHNALRMAQWDAQMFLQSDQLPVISAKIEAARNPDFMYEFRKRYDLSIQEAVVWNRWLFLLWKSLEAEYLSVGPSNELAERIRHAISYEDQQLVILSALTSIDPLFHEKFKKYVNSLIDDLHEN